MKCAYGVIFAESLADSVIGIKTDASQRHPQVFLGGVVSDNKSPLNTVVDFVNSVNVNNCASDWELFTVIEGKNEEIYYFIANESSSLTPAASSNAEYYYLSECSGEVNSHDWIIRAMVDRNVVFPRLIKSRA